ncbi:hypothetical protein ACDY97_02375 [Rhizobium mongolense]|uniref:hypothetical protein n=1 Tax=Rhizobium mongolense TaxID=57676 RepID=UPI003558433E
MYYANNLPICAEDRPQAAAGDLVAATFPGAATLRRVGLPSLLGLAKEVEESVAPFDLCFRHDRS